SLRNIRHHTIRNMMAEVLRDYGYTVYEPSSKIGLTNPICPYYRLTMMLNNRLALFHRGCCMLLKYKDPEYGYYDDVATLLFFPPFQLKHETCTSRSSYTIVYRYGGIIYSIINF
ncbi:hypothetical protein L9F63_013774, partial [Diploptera punctata]